MLRENRRRDMPRQMCSNICHIYSAERSPRHRLIVNSAHSFKPDGLRGRVEETAFDRIRVRIDDDDELCSAGTVMKMSWVIAHVARPCC